MKESGYERKLEFENSRTPDTNRENKKKRKRKILWYNPPYNINLKTDFGHQFLKLIKKHFPKDNKLHKIINNNTVKLSYSCTKNMKRIIQNHNSKILNKSDTNMTQKSCSCPRTRMQNCPLNNQCLKKSFVYKATVLKSNKFYIGITEADFKHRHSRHTYSFRHEKDKNATTLSHHIWDIKENITPENPEPAIKWEILKEAGARVPGSSICQLCLEEKAQILKHSKNTNCLNKRSELASRCNFYHRAKHKLLTM